MGEGAVANTAAGGAGIRLRRRWAMVLVGLLLGLAAATAVTAVQQVRYTAATSVLVLGTDVDASLTGSRPDVNMDTEVELIRSIQVAEVARDVLQTDTTARALLAGLEVSVPLNSQVLTVSYSDTTAASAQAGAQAFAQGYLTYRGDAAESEVAALNAALQDDLAQAQQLLRLATDQAAALPVNSPDRVYAEAQRSILGNQINSLSARLSALRAASPIPGQIITAASLPDSPTSPTTRLNYAAGLLAGLLLGAALAALADRLDHRLRHSADVSRLVGQPVLVELAVHPGAAVIGDVRNAAAFDRLRNLLMAGDGSAGPLQVADPDGRAASGHVAVGLAQSLVRATGGATLVLAHDSSAVTAWLRLGKQAGLSEVLRGTADLDSVLVDAPELPGVRLLPAGTEPGALETLMQSRTARRLLSSLGEADAPCVIETGDTGTSAAAQVVAAESARVVLVASLRVTDARVVAASAQAAQEVGAQVAGVVLTRQHKRQVTILRAGAQRMTGDHGRRDPSEDAVARASQVPEDSPPTAQADAQKGLVASRLRSASAPPEPG